MNADAQLGHNEASVIFERFGEEVVAIHLGTGRYYSLPGVAGDAFLLLAQPHTVSQLAAALAAKYDAPADVIANDLSGFLNQMKDESLIAEERQARARSIETPAEQTEPRLPYMPPAIHAHRDLENLFLVDPIHETGEAGWPEPKKSDAHAPGTPIRYRIAAERCLFEQFEDATVALNLNTGAYFSFSDSAEDILLMVNDAPTAAEIVQALEGKYVASREQLSEAVEHFLGRLMQIDLIVCEQIAADPVRRNLTLAKPGSGLVFHPPEIEMYRDAPAANDSGATGRDPSLLSRKKKFRLNRDESLVAIAGDGGVAVHLIRGVYFVLNTTAARVLRMVEQGATAVDIVAALELEYEVRRPELVAAVIVLLENLIGIGVAVAESADGERQPAPVRGTEKKQRAPFEPFSVDMRHDLREQFCLYPGGKPSPVEPASRGRQLAMVFEEYFDQASAAAPVIETRLMVAGRKLRLRCVDNAHSVHLGLAMSHLRNEFSGDADFTIDVWDGEMAGAPTNSLLASYLKTLYRDWTGCCGVRGELLGFHSPGVPAFYMPGPDLMHLVDTANRRAYFFKRDGSPFPYWEAGSPFRAILHSWLSASGLQFVHGGAVGENGAGVLLAAKGGSGKSTTTLLCLNAGMQYAGDDYCALESNDGVYVHSLYNTAKLIPRDLDRFPELRRKIWNPQSLVGSNLDKATFFLGDLMPERMSKGFPLRAILIPRVSGEIDTRLTPCGQAAALAAIAPSTVAQLPNSSQADMDRMVAITSKLPAYILHLGSDLAQIPDVVRSLLR